MQGSGRRIRGVQDDHGNLFSVNRYSRARDGAHIETEKCGKRPEAEESGPHHEHEEELLVLRTNALSDPYVAVQSNSLSTTSEGHQKTYKGNDDRISTHTTVPATSLMSPFTTNE